MSRRIALGSLSLCLASTMAGASLPALTTQHVATIPEGLVTFITQSPLEDDDRLFIGSLPGRVHVLPPGGPLDPTPFLDVSEITHTGAESGLFGIAFHPEFGDSNWFLFINHTITSGGTALARYEMSEEDRTKVDVDSRREVFVGFSFAIHNAGDIHFGPDGYLYIATGDYFVRCGAQSPATVSGKILRIDVNQNVDVPPYYGIPLGNPLAGDPSGLEEFYFMGLRNPWRFSFDRKTGDMWIADVGELTREEVNHVPFPFEGGLNFGWPMWEGDVERTTDCSPNPPAEFDELTPPVHAYPRSVGAVIIGGFVYRGAAIPLLQGRYVFGDYGRGHVWAMNPMDYSVEELFVLPRIAMATFGEDRDGEIYIGVGNQVLRIIPAPQVSTDYMEVR